MGDNVAAIAVHIGGRIMGQAAPGAVLVSGTVKDLVSGSGIDFEDRGVHQLKGMVCSTSPESPLRVLQMQSAFHPLAQRNVFRRDARQQIDVINGSCIQTARRFK
jgi:hypothetical protein